MFFDPWRSASINDADDAAEVQGKTSVPNV
jgi:hypothetical protein